MPLFDFYIMVDWSGAARRRGRRSDCIWIAHGPTEADEPVTDSPFSRTEAICLIRSVLLKEIAFGHRVFVGFDSAYGYPVDFAAAASDRNWNVRQRAAVANGLAPSERSDQG
jgi:precorrin-8X/cobalt-precorrin-8 methylmutase